MMDIAITGCGFIGRIYAQVLARLDARVVAVVDPVAASRDALAVAVGCPAFASLAEALEAVPDITAVGIATPSQHHYETAMTALTAGRHVLVEKPLALSFDQVREVVTTASEGDLKLAIGLKMRFEPIFANVRQSVSSGDIGDPLRIVVTQHQPYPKQAWARAHGIANELLVHGLDLANWLFGAPPTNIRLDVSREHTTVLAAFDGGRDALVTGAWIDTFPPLDGHSDTILQIVGTEGHLVATRPSNITIFTSRDARHMPVPTYDYADPFQHEWAAFLAWVAGEAPGDLATARDALNVHRTLAEIDQRSQQKEGIA